MAYLAKSVALPMTILVIVGIYGFRVLIRALPARVALRAAGLTLAGMLVLATPWIVIISLQQGAPTFSTSAVVAHSLVGPGDEFRTHPLFRDFDVPPDGRLTSWEDPSTLDYPEWSPLADGSMFQHQIDVFLRNILQIVELVSGFDELGLGVVACVAGFLFHHPWRETFGREPWRYSLLIVAPVSALYAPVFADEPRYYLLFYPLLVGSALAFFGELADAGRRRSESLRRSSLPAMLAVTLVVLSFSAPFLPGAAIALTRGSPTPEFHVARGFSAQLENASGGPIASIGQNDARHIAFYISYLTGRAFYGTRMGEASAEEIIESGTAYILVTVDSAVDHALAADARFASFPALMGQVAAYRLYHVMAE
jgi:hypothetical protein